MGFRYDTHLHTSQASACAFSTGAEMARAYAAAGYTGIFITDHFFNGNSCVPRDLPWAQRVERFCAGFEDAKVEGEKLGLQVFFGFEFNDSGAEFLIYNLDKQWLLEHENIDRMPTRKALSLMRQEGGFVVQAHPFRERGYLDHIQLYPRDVDAVEAVNSSHLGEEGRKMNERAFLYAKMFDLPVTAGSDSHREAFLPGGVEVTERFETSRDYQNAVLTGALTLLDG